MTVFLTFGVYALKINSDLPVQSQFVSLFSTYFIVSTIYTLIALMWFIVANYFVIKNSIPGHLVFIAEQIQLRVTQVISQLNLKKKDKQQELLKEPLPASLGSVAFIETTYRSPIESIIQTPASKEEQATKGDEDKEKENFSYSFRFLEEKKEKKNFATNLKTLNYTAFFLVFLIMSVSNISIWTSVF